MEYAMYILVNKGLKMSKGKIGAQCCHSACAVIQLLERNAGEGTAQADYRGWSRQGTAKIVLKCSEDDMRVIIDNCQFEGNINDVWCVHTIDSGRTEIPEDSLTTLAFRPIRKIDAPGFLADMKLL